MYVGLYRTILCCKYLSICSQPSARIGPGGGVQVIKAGESADKKMSCSAGNGEIADLACTPAFLPVLPSKMLFRKSLFVLLLLDDRSSLTNERSHVLFVNSSRIFR